MSTLAERFSDLLTPARRRALWAIGVAVGVHVVLLLMFAAVIPLLPDGRGYALENPDRPIQLEIERPDPTPAAAEEERKKSLDYIATNPNQKTNKPPENPDFQSSDDTPAASEKDGEAGKPPLPTMDGRDLPFFAFDTKRNTEGEKAADIASKDAAPRPGPTPVPISSRPSARFPTRRRPSPSPIFPPRRRRPRRGPRPDHASWRCSPRSRRLPPPRHRTRRSARRSLRPTSFAGPPPVPRSAAPPSVVSPGTQQLPGYQPETQQSKMVGSVSNRGAPSVSAIGTPLGRYQKAISDAIGMKWYFYTNRRMDLLSTAGTLKVHFYVNKSGHIEGLRLVSNSSNETLAGISLQAIQEAKLPPMPPEIAATLPGNRLETEYSFAIY